MLPCTMMVEVFPPSGPAHLDPHHPRILQVAAKYGVMISFREVSKDTGGFATETCWSWLVERTPTAKLVVYYIS